jgi:hypothetical protein
MRYYDHRLNGIQVRQILERRRTREIEEESRWLRLVELIALVGCIGAIVLVMELLR